MAFLLPTFGKRTLQEDCVARKRITTKSPATEQTLRTSVDTPVTMQTSDDGPPMQASSFAAESEAATEHTAAGSNTMMSMDAIVAELNLHLTDAARDVINAAQTIRKGNQDDIRKLCRPWGVQLKCQKRYRLMETIKQELKMALTRRAVELKSGTDANVGGAATERAETMVRAAAVGNPSQLLQSTASSSAVGSMLEPSQPLQSIGTHADPITNNYANLFESPDPDLLNALRWGACVGWGQRCGPRAV